MIDLIAYKKRMHINGEDKDKYSLRINPKGRLDFDKMCALIAERTTLTDYEVKFALAEVMQVIIENIEIGRREVLKKGMVNCKRQLSREKARKRHKSGEPLGF